jgi:hypothetical protein
MLLAILLSVNCKQDQSKATIPVDDQGYAVLNPEQMEDLVKRSFQYVALYNVTNKFAMAQGGWNTLQSDTQLKDHTLTDIARPNNDTFYSSALLDLRNDAMILKFPGFDSKYVSLMITAYDHYVNIPLTTGAGDFGQEGTILIYSEHTKNYDGKEIEGIDHYFKATGDFVSAVFRIMPHASDPDRFAKVISQIKSIELLSLSSYQGNEDLPLSPVAFPDVGTTDADVFENNLLEVMQFVFNHISFDPDNPLDKAVLEIYKSLGVVPGGTYNPETGIEVKGAELRAIADRIKEEEMKKSVDDGFRKKIQSKMFQPKGETDLETLLNVSILGPIGMPEEEAIYPQIQTADGEPMNAINDYVIKMSAEELPPARAFWSITLYDLENGFFIPNDQKKYSVGENAGMKLNDAGGIEIYIASEKPDGVPQENWLPIERKDINLSPTLRIYQADLDAMKTWSVPFAEKL